MSASMIRCACRSARSLIRSENPIHLWFKSASTVVPDNIDEDIDDVDIDYYNNKTVPYFPDLEKLSKLQAKYPEVTISAEEFKYVRRILPITMVPPAPENIEYPTPSGWIPPIASKQPKEYGVHRTKNNMLPIHLKKHHSGRITTTIRHIHGDIYKLNEDVQAHLKKSVNTVDGGDVMVQVHEVGCFLRYKGNHVVAIGDLLLQKGF